MRHILTFACIVVWRYTRAGFNFIILTLAPFCAGVTIRPIVSFCAAGRPTKQQPYWITMKTIEVDEDLYRYIASHTQHIGESASDILRRMLKFTPDQMSTPTAAASDAHPLPEMGSLKSASRPQDRVRAVRELLLSDEYADQKKAVTRFMLILSTLYSLDPGAFKAATESLHGRTRVYFAGDEQTLLQNGTHTKPKHVPGTPYWVITNTNTGRKCSMVEHIMLAMQLPAELAERVCGTI